MVALTRLRQDPDTRLYVARRRGEGKSDKEIRRCLKRILARKLFRLMQQALTPIARFAGLTGHRSISSFCSISRAPASWSRWLAR